MTLWAYVRRGMVTDIPAKAGLFKGWTLSESVNHRNFAHWPRVVLRKLICLGLDLGLVGLSSLPKNM